MSHEGYRLIGTGKISYEFERCRPDEYRYCVESVTHLSYQDEKAYRNSLEEKGYKVFYKNINLNYSIGKVRWRPFAGKYGRIATSPGNFDKELLIVEMPGSPAAQLRQPRVKRHSYPPTVQTRNPPDAKPTIPR